MTVVVEEEDAGFTVSPPVPELPAKLASPEYVAEIAWLPAANPFVVRAAAPPERGAVPSNVLPSKNWTEPLGDPAPGAPGATVAVSVAAWLKPEGFGAAVTAVAVDACEIAQVVWQYDFDHGIVWASTDRTDGKCSAIGDQLSPESGEQ